MTKERVDKLIKIYNKFITDDKLGLDDFLNYITLEDVKDLLEHARESFL